MYNQFLNRVAENTKLCEERRLYQQIDLQPNNYEPPVLFKATKKQSLPLIPYSVILFQGKGVGGWEGGGSKF